MEMAPNTPAQAEDPEARARDENEQEHHERPEEKELNHVAGAGNSTGHEGK